MLRPYDWELDGDGHDDTLLDALLLYAVAALVLMIVVLAVILATA